MLVYWPVKNEAKPTLSPMPQRGEKIVVWPDSIGMRGVPVQARVTGVFRRQIEWKANEPKITLNVMGIGDSLVSGMGIPSSSRGGVLSMSYGAGPPPHVIRPRRGRVHRRDEGHTWVRTWDSDVAVAFMAAGTLAQQ